VLPGLLQAAVFFAWVWYDARRRNSPSSQAAAGRRLTMAARAIPALSVPVIVLVGIYGVVTVTEAAAIAAVVSLLVSLIYYRGSLVETLWWWPCAEERRRDHADRGDGARLRSLDDGVGRSGPARQMGAGAERSAVAVPACDQRALLVLGCFLEVIATLLLVLPILAPVLPALGVDPCTSRSSSPTTWRSRWCIRRWV
jgi:C4-dicarboxylate transporter DctM subunit